MDNSNTDPQKVKLAIRGLLVFIAFLLIIIFLKVNENELPWKFYTVWVRTESPYLLKEGSPIICNQVEIGFVKNIEKKDNIHIVEANLKRKYKIPKQGLDLKIISPSKDIEAAIKVDIGEIKNPYLQKGDILDIR